MSIFPVEALLPFACVVCVGVFVQAATGFAGGLVIVPLMLWAGHGVPEAQTALLTATIPQNLLGIYRFRSTIRPKEVAFPALLRLSAIPLGVSTLSQVENFPKEVVGQIVSAVVLGCVILLLAIRPKPRENLHVGWTLLAFLSSGFFVGLTGTGGPMMVLWVQSHDWSTKKVRSFLFLMYLVSIPPILVLLYLKFGDRITTAFCSGIVVLPLVLLSTYIGLQAGSLLGRDRLRKVTMAILLFLGATGLISPFFR